MRTRFSIDYTVRYHRWMIKIPFRKFIQYINNIYYELLSHSQVWQDALHNDVIRRASLFQKRKILLNLRGVA